MDGGSFSEKHYRVTGPRDLAPESGAIHEGGAAAQAVRILLERQGSGGVSQLPDS